MQSMEQIQKPSKIFQTVWSRLEEELGANKLHFPAEILWLNGAPGAGKGTQTAFIMQQRRIESDPIVISDLLQSPEAKRLKDAGLLVGDEEVFSLLLRALLRPEFANGVIVDGYPRTAAQVECLKELHAALAKQPFEQPRFHVVVLNVDESESVRRQLNRGQEVLARNAEVERSGHGEHCEARKTDLDAQSASKRYRIFMENTYHALQSLRGVFPYHEIDAHVSVEEVREAIHREFAQF
jgi:adenylate kinase